MDWIFKGLGYIGAGLGIALANKVLLSRKTPNREIVGITMVLAGAMLALDFFGMNAVREGFNEGVGIATGMNMTGQKGGMDDPVAINYWTTGDNVGLPMDTCDRKDYHAGYPLRNVSTASWEQGRGAGLGYYDSQRLVREPEEVPNAGERGLARQSDDLDAMFLHGGRASHPDGQAPVDGDADEKTEQLGGGYQSHTCSQCATVPEDFSLHQEYPGGVAVGRFVRSDVPLLLKNEEGKILTTGSEGELRWETQKNIESEPLFRLRFLLRGPRGTPVRNGTEAYLAYTDENGVVRYIGGELNTSEFSTVKYRWMVESESGGEFTTYGDSLVLTSPDGEQMRVTAHPLEGCGPVFRMTS